MSTLTDGQAPAKLQTLKARVAELQELGVIPADAVVPCSAEEVERLERQIGYPLPLVLKEFLQWCGRGLGDIWSGAGGLDYDDLLEGTAQAQARAILEGDGLDPQSLPEPMLVFQMDESDQFACVRLDAGEDPPVYTRAEREPLQPTAERFSDYLSLLIEQAAPPPVNEEARREFLELQRAAAGAPPAENVVPPELRAEAALEAEGFGFMPPSVQRRLGKPRVAFKPSAANLFAALVFGVVLLGFGTVLVIHGLREAGAAHFRLPLMAREGLSWLVLLVLEAISLFLVGVGIALIRRALQITRTRVFLGDAGLCQMRGHHFEVMNWREMRAVEEVILRDRFPLKYLLAYLLPAGHIRRYIVRLGDGRQFAFDANNVRNLRLFHALLHHAARLHGLPWHVIEASL